jgi:hypothetical protein
MKQKEESVNYLGIIVLIFLCSFCFIAISEQTENPAYDSSQYGLVSELQSHTAEFVPAKIIQLPSIQKNCLPVLFTQLFLLNESYNRNADDRKIEQRIILIGKTQLKIKPLSICRYNFHRLRTDNEELPSLS